MHRPLIHIVSNPALRAATLALVFSGCMFASSLPYRSLIGIQTLGLGDGMYSGMLIAISLISVTVSVLIGIITDLNGNRRGVIAISLIAGVVGNSLVYFVPDPIVFLLSHILLIPIAMSSYVQLFAVVRQALYQLPKVESDQIISNVRAIFAFSWVATPPVISVALEMKMPLIGVYLIAASAALACFLLMTVFWPSSAPEAKSAQPSRMGFWQSLRELFDASLIRRVLVISMITGCQQLYMAVFGLLITGPIHGSEADVGLFAGIVAFMEIPFMMMIGAMLKRLSVAVMIVLGAVVFSLFLLAFASVYTMESVYFLTVPCAFGNAVIVSLSINYLQNLIADRPGTGSSLISVSSFIGSGYSSIAFAVGAALFGYSGTAMIAALLGLTGATLLYLLDVAWAARQGC